ncbi:hypothetical protein BGW37DRAFT_502053 [Umbelopsis sp. PMI_123]|nr:hypothetical protein BGW37DRAFT_502053 [Umbelopsis sp. PMI_123]
MNSGIMYGHQPGRGRPPRKFPQSYRPHTSGGHSIGPSRIYSQHFQRRRFSVSSDTPDMSLAKWESEQNVFSDYRVREHPTLNLPRQGLYNLFNWTNAAVNRRRRSTLLDILPKDTQLQTRSKLPLSFPSPAYTRRKSRSEHGHPAPKAKNVASSNDTSSSYNHDQELHWIEQWTPPPLSPTDEIVKYSQSLYTSEETSENESYSDILQMAKLGVAVNGFTSTPKDETSSVGDDDIGTPKSTVITLGDLNALTKAASPTITPSQLNGSSIQATSSSSTELNENENEVRVPPDTEAPSDALTENNRVKQQPENGSLAMSETKAVQDTQQVESTTETNQVRTDELELPEDRSDVSDNIQEPELSAKPIEYISPSPSMAIPQEAENSIEMQDELEFPHTPLNSIKEEENIPEVPIWADPDKMQQHPTEYQKAVTYLKDNGIAFDSSLPLLHNVILYFSDTSTAKAKNANSYSSTIRPMFLCETVWQFSSRWRKFKERFSAPSQMLPNQNLYFFKQGVEPMWEDPINSKGGRMTLSPTKMALDEIWEVVLSAFVGGTCHNSVVGVVMSRRGRGDRIEIWMDEQGREASDQVRTLLLRYLPPLIQDVVQLAKYKKHFDR